MNPPETKKLSVNKIFNFAVVWAQKIHLKLIYDKNKFIHFSYWIKSNMFYVWTINCSCERSCNVSQCKKLHGKGTAMQRVVGMGYFILYHKKDVGPKHIFWKKDEYHKDECLKAIFGVSGIKCASFLRCARSLLFDQKK